jgi:hypothetical protein
MCHLSIKNIYSEGEVPKPNGPKAAFNQCQLKYSTPGPEVNKKSLKIKHSGLKIFY